MSNYSDEENHKRRSRSPYDDNNSKKSRFEVLEMETRFLIPSRYAGAIIGKSGATINMLRDRYSINLSLPDSSTPERILTLTGGNVKKHIDCLDDIFLILKEGNRIDNVDKVEIRLIVHQSQAGAVIGRGGQKIKDMREKTGASVKVFSTMCPNSTDRIVLIAGSAKEIKECMYEVYDTLDKAPPKGSRHDYNANNYDYYQAPEYGGYQGDEPRKDRNGRGRRDEEYPGGYGYMNPFTGYFPDMMMGFGQPGKGPQSLVPNYKSQSNEPETNTQVTIPKDLAGSIIGKGGERIRHIREQSSCKIKIDEEVHGDNERIITIEGTPDNIRYAQILLQDAVKRFGGRRAKL